MCRLFGAIKKENADKNAFGELMLYTLHFLNHSDGLGGDGVGVLAILKSGDARYTKILDKGESFNTQEQVVKFLQLHEKELTAVFLHNRFGTHGGKTFKNTHPIVKENIALMHNGVISGGKRVEVKVSDTDSEMIIDAYIQAKRLKQFFKNLKKIQGDQNFFLYDAKQHRLIVRKDTTLISYKTQNYTYFASTEEQILPNSKAKEKHLKDGQLNVYDLSKGLFEFRLKKRVKSKAMFFRNPYRFSHWDWKDEYDEEDKGYKEALKKEVEETENYSPGLWEDAPYY